MRYFIVSVHVRPVNEGAILLACNCSVLYLLEFCIMCTLSDHFFTKQFETLLVVALVKPGARDSGHYVFGLSIPFL